MKLTIRKSEALDDWYTIERAEHDGGTWLKPLPGGGVSLQCSSRFSDADVEGTASEMLVIAESIERRDSAWFRRCAVELNEEGTAFRFWSPRNSTEKGECSLEEADDLAREIRALLGART